MNSSGNRCPPQRGAAPLIAQPLPFHSHPGSLNAFSPTGTQASLVLALLLTLLIATGCDQQSQAAAKATGTPANPYQTIPPPLIPPQPPWSPQSIHGSDGPLPSPTAARLVECRNDFARAESAWPQARPLQAQSWLYAEPEFRLLELNAKLSDWIATPDRPILILADTDHAAAAAWLMLRAAGLNQIQIVWGGPERLQQAGWQMTAVPPPAPDSQPPIESGIAADPDWLLADVAYAQLTAGRTPVSTRRTADPTPIQPSPAAPEPADGFIYCGSAADWSADAAADRLVEGAVRVPTAEMYRMPEGRLELLAIRQARLAQLKLDPAKRYVLIGPTPTDIAAIYLALHTAGYNRLRIYLP